jgi:hypothetical protein
LVAAGKIPLETIQAIGNHATAVVDASQQFAQDPLGTVGYGLKGTVDTAGDAALNTAAGWAWVAQNPGTALETAKLIGGDVLRNLEDQMNRDPSGFAMQTVLNIGSLLTPVSGTKVTSFLPTIDDQIAIKNTLNGLQGLNLVTDNGKILSESGNLVSDLLYGARSGEGLPGTQGVSISGRPSPSQLDNLSAKHNVEFAVTYKYGLGENGRGGQYYLHSGKARSVEIPLEADRMLIYHTHPGGTAGASLADMRIMKYLESIGSPQRSSQIVPSGKDVIRFSGDLNRF